MQSWFADFVCFSGLLRLPLQSIRLLCHDDKYPGAYLHQLRNHAASGHVSVALRSSSQNVQSDAVSQLFNWKSLKSLLSCWCDITDPTVRSLAAAQRRAAERSLGLVQALNFVTRWWTWWCSYKLSLSAAIQTNSMHNLSFFKRIRHVDNPEISDIGHRWVIWSNPWWIPSRRYFPCS